MKSIKAENIIHHLKCGGFEQISEEQGFFLANEIFKGESLYLEKMFQMKNNGSFSRKHLYNIWEGHDPAFVICESESNHIFGMYYQAPWERFHKKNLIFNLDNLSKHRPINDLSYESELFIILFTT